MASPGPPPGLVFPEHDLPAGVLVQVALLRETMPEQLGPAPEIDRPVVLGLQPSWKEPGSSMSRLNSQKTPG